MQHQKIIILGATSGIGRETALRYIRAGWRVGVAGRREELLMSLVQEAPERVSYAIIDITSPDAVEAFRGLIEELGGLDYYLHVSGIGFQNPTLEPEVELRTVATNCAGFTRMVDAAYRYLREQKQGGHIAVVSSIAGTKGLGVAPAYSATKRYQNTYIDALAQLAHLNHEPVTFTDIRPGFVRTELLNDNQRYPLQMRPEKVAQRICKALQRRERRVVIDWRYRLLVFAWRLIPNALWERLPIRTKSKE